MAPVPVPSEPFRVAGENEFGDLRVEIEVEGVRVFVEGEIDPRATLKLRRRIEGVALGEDFLRDLFKILNLEFSPGHKARLAEHGRRY